MRQIYNKHFDIILLISVLILVVSYIFCILDFSILFNTIFATFFGLSGINIFIACILQK